MDENLQFNDDEGRQPQRSRKMLWYGRYDEELTWLPKTMIEASQTKQRKRLVKPPHPLRTDLWNLNIHWKKKEKRKFHRQRRATKQKDSSIEVVEFHRNGYCRCPSLGVGEWELYPWGVQCTLIEDETQVEYTLFATVHFNPFGDHPKMIQGTILKSSSSRREGREQPQPQIDPIQDHYFVKESRNKKWFRPVVATFTGQGIGIDTADFSYSNRGIGLTQ